MFRVGEYNKFGETLTLAAADGDGMRGFASALGEARIIGRSIFDPGDGIHHQIVEQNGAADIGIWTNHVVWKLDRPRLNDLIELVQSLIETGKPAHQYLDEMQSPTTTLMLSIDEFGSDIFEQVVSGE